MKEQIKSIEEKIHIAKKSISCEKTKDGVVKEYRDKIKITTKKKK